MNPDELKLLLSLEVQQMGQDLLEGLGGALEGLVGKGEELKGLDAVLGGIGKTLATVGVGMVAAGAALGGAIGALASEAASYQTQVTALVTGAGESRAAIDQVSQGILDMAGQVGDAPIELAKGLYMIESAGFHGADGLTVLQASAEAAKIGLANQATVADGLTSILNAYSLSVADAAGVTGQMTATVAAGKMHMEDLAGSLGQVIPIASAYHISFQQIGAALATLTSQGMPVQNAARAIGMSITQLGNESSKGAAALKEIGLSSQDVATRLASGDFLGTLTMIEEHLGKKLPQGSAEYDSALKSIMGAQNSFRAGVDLMGPHLKTFQDNIASIGTVVQGAAKEQTAWDLVNKDAAQQWDKLKAQLSAASTEIGLALLPSLQELMKSLSGVVQQVVDFVKTHADLIASVMLGAAKFLLVAGTIITVVGGLALLVAAVNPVVLIIGIVAGVIAALASSWGINWQSIQDTANLAISWIQQALYDLSVTVQAVVNVASELLNDWGVTTSNVSRVITGAFDSVESGLSGLSSSFTNVLQGILDTVNSVGQSIHDALSYLDPYAEHSPSLVAQVSSGVQAIVDSYVSLGRIQAPIQDTGAVIAQFVSMGKDALTSLADTTKMNVDNIKGTLDELKAALAAAKSDLSTLASTPIEGTKAFEDKKFGLTQQQEVVQLQIDQAKLAGASKDALKPLEKQLADLGLQASIVDLQEKLKLDPLKKQLADLANLKPEMPFQQIIDGMKKAREDIPKLTAAIAPLQKTYDGLNQSLKDMNQALQDIAKNTAGGKGGAPLPVPHPEAPAPSTAATHDIQAMINSLHDIATAHQEAADAAHYHYEQEKTFSDNVAAQMATVKAALTPVFDTLRMVGDIVRSVVNPAIAGLSPIIAAVRDTLADCNPIANSFQGIIHTLSDAIQPCTPLMDAFNGVLGQMRPLFDDVKAAAGPVAAFITGVLMGAFSAFVGFLNGALPGAIQDVTGMLEVFEGTLEIFRAVVEGVVKVVVDLIHGDFAKAWLDAKTSIDLFADGAKKVVQGMLDIIVGSFNVFFLGLDKAISGWINGMVAFFQHLSDELVGHSIIPDMLKAILDAWTGAWTSVESVFSDAWTGILSMAKSSINTLIGFLDHLINAWDSLHFHIDAFDSPLTGHFGGIDIGPTHINDIPLLDQGGIVSRPTLAMLAMNSVPEVVAPLPALQAMLGGGNGRGVTLVLTGNQFMGSLTEADVAYWGDKLARYINQQWALYGQHA